MCVYTADIYDSRSDRFDDMYHETNVKNHSFANSLQVSYFLIRRAAKKVTSIENMRTDLRVCECVCILPIYTIHAVTVLTTFMVCMVFTETANTTGSIFEEGYALDRAGQHRTTKMITSLGKLPYEQRLNECKLTTLEERQKRGDMLETHNIMHGLESIREDTFFTRADTLYKVT